MEAWMPHLVEDPSGSITLGQPLIDEYLELVRARARRNTLLATAYDLKVFFGAVEHDPLEVSAEPLILRTRQFRFQPESLYHAAE